MKTKIYGLGLAAALFISFTGWATTGPMDNKQLLASEEKFAAEFNEFQVNEDDLARMKLLEGKRLVVLFGTWCPDSQREVPRLLKLIEQSGVKLAKLELVAVDREKQDPDGLHRQFDLKYTPTFVVMDGDKELLRVVEKPEKSLAEDLTIGL